MEKMLPIDLDIVDPGKWIPSLPEKEKQT